MTARTGLFTAVDGSGNGTAPTDGRLALAGIVGTNPRPLTGGTITQSSSTMQFTVTQSVWALPDVTNSAAVFVSPTDAATVTLSPGPGSGSRIDSIVVKQNNPENGDSDSRANVSVIAGTAATTPTAPTIPAGYFEAARVTVPTSASTASACTVTLLSGGSSTAPSTIQASSAAALTSISGTTGQMAIVGTSTYKCFGGTSWKIWSQPATTYTPTLTGITLGNGTRAGVYWVESGVMHGSVAVTWGSTTTMSGTSYVSLPLTAADLTHKWVGGGWAHDTSAGDHLHIDAMLDTTGRMILTTIGATSTASIGAGAPWTWANGDEVTFQFVARLP